MLNRIFVLLFVIIQCFYWQSIHPMLSRVSRIPKNTVFRKYPSLIRSKPIPKNIRLKLPRIIMPRTPVINQGKNPRFSIAALLAALGFGWLSENKEEVVDSSEIATTLQQLKESYNVTYELINFLKTNQNTKKAEEVFTKLIDDEDLLWKLYQGLINDKEFDRKVVLPDILVPFIKKNYAKLSLNFPGVEILDGLIAKDPKNFNNLASFAQENFDTICQNAEDDYLFQMLMRHNPNIVDDFSTSAQGRIASLLNTRAGKSLIDDQLIKKNNAIAKERALLLLNSSTIFSPAVFNTCLTTLKDDTDIELLIKKTHKDNDLSSLLKELIYKKHCQHCIKELQGNPSLSMRSLYDNIESWANINTMNEYIIRDPRLSHLVMEALHAENKDKNEGYYTFYHGQSSKLGFSQRWFSWLHDMNNKKPDLFLPVIYDMPTTKKEADEENKNLDRAIQAKADRAEYSADNPLALFTSENLFSNIVLRLIVTNSSAALTPSITTKTSFAKAGALNVYTHFQKQLENLETEYKQLHDKGQLLQFSIRKDKLKEFVYPSGDAPHAAIQKEGTMEPTNDPLLILNTLEKDPKKVQLPGSFLVAITSKLKNSDGVKVRAFNAVDQDKWQAYKEKEHRLREDIKKYVAQQKS